MALTVKFKINSDYISLCIEDQPDLMFKLTNDDEYTSNYINELVKNKFITVPGEEIQSIFRVQDNNEEILIFDYDIDDSSASEQKKDVWGDAETHFILDKYECYLSMVGPLKRFKTKKKLWEQITSDLQAVLNIKKTATQIENRYKTVMKRKKKAVDNNSSTGECRQKIPFEEELAKIAAADDSIEPEVLQSAQSTVILKQSPSTSGTCTPAKKKIKRETSLENSMKILLEQRGQLHADREASRERRHQEKIELIREIFTSRQNSKE